MRTSELLTALLTASILTLGFLPSASTYGQETTERYIPIGKSPGISDKYSFIGTITHVDESEHTIEIDSNRGRRTVKITEETRIWLDRSGMKQTNTVGAYGDCEIGKKVEVMHVRGDESVADWIKIESQ